MRIGSLSLARAALAVCIGALVLGSGADAHAKKKRAAPADKPIAFYLAQGHKGLTKASAIAKCRFETEKRRRALLKQRAKYPGLIVTEDASACPKGIVTVRGPHQRKPVRSTYDDAEVFVYRGSDGVWYDKTGDTPCFAPGTPVATPDGQRAIEDLRPGDVVLAYDVAARRVVPSTVERTKRRTDKRIGTLAFSDGTSVGVTPNHPFYSATARAWVEAGLLAVGDRVLALRSGAVEEVELVDKTAFDRGSDVYDVTIARLHDYFAGGVLVHNY